MTRFLNVIATCIISLITCYGCGGTNPTSNGPESRSQDISSIAVGELGALLTFTRDQHLDLSALVYEHTTRTRGMIEYARINGIAASRVKKQMEVHHETLRQGFYQSLTPGQMGGYEAVSKRILHDYYSGSTPVSALDRLVMVIEGVQDLL